MRFFILAILLTTSSLCYSDGKEEALANLVPYYQFKGQPEQTHPLADRMEYFDVPGINITLFDRGEILWTHSQGIKNQQQQPVEKDTVFQVASMSKPVVGLLVLKAVEEGKVTLDQDIRPLLIPELQAKTTYSVTLRQLLSHTGGFPMQGSPEFDPDETLPTLGQFAQSEQGSTYFAQNKPDGTFNYSNAGFALVQSVLETLYKQPLHELAKQRLWQPLKLKNMTFQQESVDELGMDLAHGHRYGSWLPEQWKSYPTEASAGLWTSTPDFAALLLALHKSLKSDSFDFMRAETVRSMYEPTQPFFGLAIYRYADQQGEYLFHGGINKGFESHFVLYPELGSGAVITTNGQSGDGLALEIMRALSRSYQWPNYQIYKTEVLDSSGEDLSPYVGRYHYSDDFYADITAKNGHLYVHGKGQLKFPLYKIETHRFKAINFNSEFVFELDTKTENMVALRQISPFSNDRAVKE